MTYKKEVRGLCGSGAAGEIEGKYIVCVRQHGIGVYIGELDMDEYVKTENKQNNGVARVERFPNSLRCF